MKDYMFWSFPPLILLFSLALISIGSTFTVDNTNVVSAFSFRNPANTLQKDWRIMNSHQTTLANLFVLNQLFNDNEKLPLQSDGFEKSAFKQDLLEKQGLGRLFILDQLFENHSNGLLNPHNTDLGDLFILDQLFSSSESLMLGGDEFETRLGELFILDRLFRSETEILNPEHTTLGDLFILDQLFPRESAN